MPVVLILAAIIYLIMSNQEKDKKIIPPAQSNNNNNTIVPIGLPEIFDPQFESFDKFKFFKQIKKMFPNHYADIYRIMAWETAHFKSKQFIYTGSAGMEVHKPNYPYGWTSAKDLWRGKMFAPDGYKIFVDGAKRRRAFLAFRTPLAFAAYLNIYLNKYRAGRWRSTKLATQLSYEAKISGIRLPNIT